MKIQYYRQYYEERARVVENTVVERNEVNEEVDVRIQFNKIMKELLQGIDEGMSQLFNGNGNVEERQDEILPPGWEMQIAPNGRTFFINHNTRKTTWQ